MKISGKEIADKITSDLKIRADALKQKGITPHIYIIMLSQDKSSESYVKQKILRGEKIGAKVTVDKQNPQITTENLLTLIGKLNQDNTVHGIIVQRPLPTQIDNLKINEAVIPEKDVDGFNSNSKFETPVAKAVIKVLEEARISYQDKKFVVIGQGITAGGPIIKLLQKKGIQPEIITSKTENKSEILKQADIVISAVGKAKIINQSMLKKGVILIGVGLHPEDGMKGDYEEEDIEEVSKLYTPTPGGIGPLNVTFLFQNLIEACENSHVK